MIELKKNTAKIGDVEAAYWTNKFDSKRPTLVMIHGFRGDHHGMLKIATELGSAYNLFIPDLPGFGQTPALSGRSHNLDAFVDFLDGFISSLRLKNRPHLLAHSFGTTIASAFVATHSEKIDKLVLLSPIAARPIPSVARPAMSLLRIMPERLGRLLTGTNFVTDTMSRATTTTKDRELRCWIKAEHRRFFNSFSTHKSMIETMTASSTHHVSEFAHAVPNQTLIITGDKDRVGKFKHQITLNSSFPHAEVRVIPDVGHLTHYEVPDQVAAATRAFLG
jgi:pimeloyl-ACP methyl ester carboxylesterase